jgi:hypothetical protein
MTNNKEVRIMQANLRRDTRAWQVQVWMSFGVALFFCAVGLLYLPGSDIERAFMVMGYVFCLTATFVLAKQVRDEQEAQLLGRSAGTRQFRFLAWAGFAAAMILTGWGLVQMQVSDTYKAYLLIGWLYLVTTAFTLAKMLRDAHDASQPDNARPELVHSEREAAGRW